MLTKRKVNKLIHKSLGDKLKDFGFESWLFSDGGILFTKKTSHIDYMLGLDVDYSYTDKVVKISGCTPSIRCNKLEEIVTPPLVKHGVYDAGTKVIATRTLYIKAIGDNHAPSKTVSIHTLEDIDMATKDIFELFQVYYHPLFRSLSSNNLSFLYHLVKESNEYQYLWDNLGRQALYKYPAILRLFGDEAYYKEIAQGIAEAERYYKENPKDKDLIKDLNVMLELKEILDQIEPIYTI